MTRDELLSLPVTVDVETAGRAFGVGRTVAYRMVRDGEFPVPVLRVGNKYRVSSAELWRALGVAPE
ncbi:helix-turn-helix domain-containing protein [Streptomyces sp. Li-HN-5-11]|uniref:helix-turn-helix domain-containing protein n=1 Tax=Streptomyces sp. Li-HN-5-11 TaxID=3075432 RepID=UPI0028A6A922|nr:helix-turn-helix domain-containing protein [Streptomyces sp. Li-HN-5-11]WNM34970.1 helix-turn-helix domain-containing protein [Streptomyces sp. Li-HN-5-11]